MTLRIIGITSVLVVVVSGHSSAQEIIFSNNTAYQQATANSSSPRVTLHGYSESVTQSSKTYLNVGVVLSNSYSTYNDVANPAANSPGTTFAYATNSPFGALPTSFSWQVDMPLPVQNISTDPSNPTYITASFYLVDKNGNPYKNSVFSTYCFMTYVVSGKVMTSPAGGPYFVIVPPTTVSMDAKDNKDNQASTKAQRESTLLPAPKRHDVNLNGFWEFRPSSLCPGDRATEIRES